MAGRKKTAEAPVLAYPPFNPPRWMRNSHFQTIVASRKPRRWSYGWETWETIPFDLGREGALTGEASWQPGRKSDSPLVFFLHGLEGSAQSHYLIGMSRKAYCAGFHTVRVNTRNCGGTEHLTPTLYCAGLTQDVMAIVLQLRARGVREIYGAGVSLGANTLLKFLGEQGDRGGDFLEGASVLSPPIDLAEGVCKMEEKQNRIYQRYFMDKLIERMRRKTAIFPAIADMSRVSRIRTIYEFDDLVTAPHFGFGSADNYYRMSSCGPLLKEIRVPTLIIQAQDDPLIPFESFRRAGIEQNPFIRLLAPRHGGHTGFLGFRPAAKGDRDSYWGESRVVQFLSSLADEGREV